MQKHVLRRETLRWLWKSKFLYRYRPEGIFRIFFGLILDPPRYICFYSEKRQIHLYRPFFSPWHGLFRKKGGTGAGIRFYFPCGWLQRPATHTIITTIGKEGRRRASWVLHSPSKPLHLDLMHKVCASKAWRDIFEQRTGHRKQRPRRQTEDKDLERGAPIE